MDIRYFMVVIIIIYVPFHFFEEALGNFPKWMYEHKWIPEPITYGHWMANNIFFYLPLLMLGCVIYQVTGEKALFLGIGIMIWGIINFIDHMVYSIIDRRISPGIFTGFLFGIIAAIGLFRVYSQEKLTIDVCLEGGIAALIYAFLPVILSIVFHKPFKNIFNRF